MARPTTPHRQSHKEALLALLSDYQPHPMAELLRVGGYRYGARLMELRRGRHLNIQTIPLGGERFAYQLLPPDPVQLLLGLDHEPNRPRRPIPESAAADECKGGERHERERGTTRE